jgi:hypothetical protein
VKLSYQTKLTGQKPKTDGGHAISPKTVSSTLVGRDANNGTFIDDKGQAYKILDGQHSAGVTEADLDLLYALPRVNDPAPAAPQPPTL